MEVHVKNKLVDKLLLKKTITMNNHHKNKVRNGWCLETSVTGLVNDMTMLS